MIKKEYAVIFGWMVVTFHALCSIEGKFVFKVVDEQGVPIKDAVIEMDTVAVVDAKDPSKSYKDVPIKGITDCNGCWSMEGKTHDKPAASAQKNGYYDSVVRFVFDNWKTKPWRWNPYEQTATIILRKINNPITMYAWSMYMADKITMTNAWVGYDMLQAEWMPPYGKGMIEDVQFRFVRNNLTQPQWANTTNFVSMRFLGDQNGLIGIHGCSVSEQSAYKWPYNAPRDGYIQKEYTVFISPRSNPEELVHIEINTGTTNCFFRIRSRLDKDGNFIEGLYGKMRGPLDVSVWKKKTSYDLIYYVNPTPNDLNMEFDPKKNLVPKKEAKNAVGRP